MTRRLHSAAAFVAALLVPVALAAQTTRDVCASGCTYSSLQTAINAAVCGDTITLAATETFTGNFQLTNTAVCSTPITIRTTAIGSLPASGRRVSTGYGPDANGNMVANGSTDHRPSMPNVVAPTGGIPALRTATGARDYVIIGIEFRANPGGFTQPVELGVNTSAQRLVAHQPRNITIDRCMVLGDPVFGQKVGIDLNGANLTVRDSWIEHMAGMGQDAIAVRGINGSGPITIVNNFIEGAAYSVIMGGDDPWLMTQALVNAGATTTAATLSSFRDKAGATQTGQDHTTLRVGQQIAFLTGAGTRRRHTYVLSCGTSTPGATCTSPSITYDPISEAPDTGASSDVRWGEILNGITMRRNYLFKRPAWMGSSPIIAALGTVTATPQTGTGSLAAGTYYYRVSPYTTDGYNNNNAYGSASTEVSATLSATGQVNLSWAAVPNATNYRVYRGTTAGAVTGYFVVGTNSATDSGGALTSSTSVPSSSKWIVKNAFEMKFGTNWQVDSNIFDYSWLGADIGYGSWWKSNNQGAACEFCATRDAVLEKNIFRHFPGVLNILGRSRTGADEPPPIEGVTFRNNLIDDSSTAWLQGGATTYAIKIEAPTKNLTFDHNTWIHRMRGFLYLVGSSSGTVPTNTNSGLVVTNNVMRRETYGVFGGASCAQGVGCLNVWAPGAVFNYNAMSGGSGSAYTSLGTNNLFPSVTDWETLNFNNYNGGANGDYTLQDSSAWKGTGSGGTDRGADMSLVLSATNGVKEGLPEGGSGVTPPTITTVTLPNATQSSAYSTTIAATGGTTPYIWSVLTGSLPTGITLSSAGVLSGTPSVNGTFNFTARVTDSTSGTALTDDQALSLVVQAPFVTLDITTTTLPNAQIPLPYSQQLAATGGTTPYTWSQQSGSLPAGLTLSGTGLISGIPTTAGASTFTALVTDAGGATDTQSLSITVTAESQPCASRPPRVNFGEGVLYRRPTGVSAKDCPQIGDLVSNTSGTGDKLQRVAAVSPSIVLEPVGASNAPHALLGPGHSDTTTETPSGGSMIVGLESGQWGQLPPGDGFLTQSGGTFSYTLNIAESQLPNIINRNRFNADVFGVNAYTVFTATADPGAPSSTIYARIFYDSATSKLKAWENGTLKDVIGGATTVPPATIGVVTGNAGLGTSNVPGGGGELVNSQGRHRFRHDTTNYTQVSMFGYIITGCADDAGNANGIAPEFQLQYWDGAAWQAAGSAVSCTASGLKDTIAFTTLVTGARGQGKIFRMYWTDGDGAQDPSITQWYVNFR